MLPADNIVRLSTVHSVFYPNLRNAASAFSFVRFSFSPKYLSNCFGVPSGGPPSMIFRILLFIPIERSFDSARTLDKATYTASHFWPSSKRLGNLQWNISPGSQVFPCNTWSVVLFSVTNGCCLLFTFAFAMVSCIGISGVQARVILHEVTATTLS